MPSHHILYRTDIRHSAGAVTIYKTSTLHGLLSLKDFTYAVDDVILWTK